MSISFHELRTAFWHARHGGLTGLQKWWISRLATTPSARRVSPHSRLRSVNANVELREAWKDYQSHQKWIPASLARSLQPFPRGWFIGEITTSPSVALPKDWLRIEMGKWILRYDPWLEVNGSVSPSSPVQIVILGHAADSRLAASNAEQLLIPLLRSVEESSDWAALDRLVEGIGGRYIIFARRGNSLRIHVDPMASRSCYYARGRKDLIAASHSALIAEATGESEWKRAKWVLSHPDYDSPAGKYLPGTITSHDCASLVFANCVLDIGDDGINHSRFFRPVVSRNSVPEATTMFVDELRFQMSAILSRYPRSTLALTAGTDSKAILTATLDLLQQSSVRALTYHFFERNASHSRHDLLGANTVAMNAGLQHLLLEVKPWKHGTSFAHHYFKTFPSWARFPSLAKSYAESLQKEEALIIGIGGEIGTAFYRHRDKNPLSPKVLASKFTQSAFKDDPALHAVFEDYLKYTQTDSALRSGIDLYDLFYWEHRMSSWAAYGYAEADFGPEIALPLNSRRCFSAMLSVPYPDRVSRSIYRQLSAWSGID